MNGILENKHAWWVNLTCILMLISIFGFEKYLNHLSFPYRRDITRLYFLSHKFNIEIGRYARVDRADRLCSKCSLGVLGNEIHFLLECPAFNTSKESFIGLASDRTLGDWVILTNIFGF